MNDTARQLPQGLAQAREGFLDLVAGLRPELHRYASRLTGSVVDGEDVVQDTLAKAFYAMSLATEVPPLRPWLFRIAHNTAVDRLKRHERRYVETRADLDDVAQVDERVDPSVVRAALSRFLELPVAQRSAVILKDVLGCSLEEAADTMGTTVPAVKAALVRGRGRLREVEAVEPEGAAAPRAARGADREQLETYVALFNAKDWDGVRALLGEDCRLDLVGKAARRGREVASWLGRYQAEPALRLAVVSLEGQEALGVLLGDAGSLGETPKPPAQPVRPAYFILLSWEGGRVVGIRDYRYARYVADEADLALLSAPPA
jgi:RNA polymerase sigma-70 factor, ECF subfamily